MNILIKTVILGLVSYFVYNYIVLPISVPELDKFRQSSGQVQGSWNEKELFWFIQITDLHISKYVYPDIKDDLKEFFTTTLDTVKPKVVIASGDLTDAKDADGVDSFQQKEEWDTYKSLLDEHNVSSKTVYLDIRGNHDTFDVTSYKDPHNYFLSHSKSGPAHLSSYITTLHSGGKTFSFIALDATLNPGPKKVFNFFGYLSDSQLETLGQLKATAEKSDYQIYFGHFPSSCIVSSTPVMEMMSGGLVYLSGHLHTLGGLAPQLYTLHHTGTPELELGDWKENRRYRIVAVDNGMMSFTDQQHGSWPAVIITNPKRSDFIAPQVEQVENILASKAIRVLAFSPNEISKVRVKINKEDWVDCEEALENVFTTPWDPSDYVGTENVIRVEVIDGFGDSKEIAQKFVVDTNSIQQLKYSLYARLILMSEPHSVLQFCWFSSFLLCISPLLLARYLPSKLEALTGQFCAQQLKMFARHSFLFNMYTSTCLYVTFGPWHVGEILSGHVGFIFPWATIVRGTVLPSFYPYMFSFVHLAFFHFPLLWALVFKLHWRVAESLENKLSMALTNIPITLVMSMQAILLVVLYFYPSKLGIFREIALLLAPVEIGTIFVGFLLNGVVSYSIREDRKAYKK
eukprot:GFUD01034927.1.p1 GENE.GFUD01034927.1~~GFUD01034927.1.p1  ORF type:complete len:629 (-),score=170.63 GFUD01034927.1:311-2197(-)